MAVTRDHILIIGGGVIGLSIASELRRRSAGRITVVERNTCGLEASWAAAGMLSPQADTDEGGPFFDLTVRSRDLYPHLAAWLEDETRIDIGFDQTGTLYLCMSEADAGYLKKRYEWQTNAGLHVERLDAADARRMEPFASPDVLEAYLFPRDWQVDNRKLLSALKKYAELNDISIVENMSVDEVLITRDRATGVKTAGGKVIEADEVVIATGAWTSGIKLGDVRVPVSLGPVRGQIVAYQTAKRVFDHVLYSRRGYIVPRADGRVLAGSTSERVGFDKSTTAEAADSITRMAIEIAPSLASLNPADQWAGLRPSTPDGLPVLGPIAGIKGLTIATGHYRNGILLAPVTAQIVADRLVSSIESNAFTTFGADRFRFAIAGS